VLVSQKLQIDTTRDRAYIDYEIAATALIPHRQHQSQIEMDLQTSITNMESKVSQPAALKNRLKNYLKKRDLGGLVIRCRFGYAGSAQDFPVPSIKNALSIRCSNHFKFINHSQFLSISQTA
jgi:hypothetical protein